MYQTRFDMICELGFLEHIRKVRQKFSHCGTSMHLLFYYIKNMSSNYRSSIQKRPKLHCNVIEDTIAIADAVRKTFSEKLIESRH